MSDQFASRKQTTRTRKSGDLQRAVRSQVLAVMREAEPATVALTQGAFDYLATRASGRILRELGRRKATEGVSTAAENITKVIDILQQSEQAGGGQLPSQPLKRGFLNLRSVSRMVELEEICGVFPFC